MLESIRRWTCAATPRSRRPSGRARTSSWGPNAAGKTSLLEAIVLLGWGRSHRTIADGELIRWGADLARVEGRVGERRPRGRDRRAPGRTARGGRKRIRVNGVGRRASALGRTLRVVLFAPEEMLLVIGAPSLRRAALDRWPRPASRPTPTTSRPTAGRSSSATACCGRSARRRATRDELRFWDATLLDAGGAGRRGPAAPARATSPSRSPRPTPRSPRTRRPPAG